ncbi:ribophorin II (RPN2) family protein [Striga asiatica]|uniref:Ribophorin II (RPN2) family protein n=1 Tax=Striga asiatica TaxID=4170 RepID=A0A5A7R284_STRAF|nr:ribophorin II (RPN2) family protein [Striga asiatica]
MLSFELVYNRKLLFYKLTLTDRRCGQSRQLHAYQLCILQQLTTLTTCSYNTSHRNFDFHFLPISKPDVQSWESTPSMNCKKADVVMIPSKHSAYLTMSFQITSCWRKQV